MGQRVQAKRNSWLGALRATVMAHGMGEGELMAGSDSGAVVFEQMRLLEYIACIRT